MSLLLIIVFCSSYVFSQVTFIIHQSNPYNFSTKDVWNLSIINPLQNEIDARLICIIYDAGQQKIAQLTSAAIKINKGVSQLTPFTVETQNIDYYDALLSQREQQALGLMPGYYKVCIIAECETPDCNGTGPNSITFETPLCQNIIVENPTPLLLIDPEHRSEIEQTKPTLVWQPPSPILNGTQMVYHVTLTPKTEDQSILEAMQLNRPIFTHAVEQFNTHTYPLDIPELEIDHYYVWRVEAKVNEKPIATSEVWQFKVVKPKKKRYIPKIFVKINDIRNDAHPAEDTLRFIYLEDRFAKSSISYRILSQNGEQLQPSKKLSSQMGENKYILDLRPLGLKDGEIYSLEVMTPLNTLLPLKFIFYSSGN